ncbi:uncharacterized protein LOC126742901 [Anthonomus grandis grandis]|uniref:uncharacterized protein LOC126742901 n=1 Tax=Anthonomus grandis grandis TaxID=2921223 RepID=UPI002166BF6E|nr:uncharacterized protein LOC126742901 [Anthonomus grandis grandis]
MNIAFICLPSNATHVMQPLDVAFYSPLKKYWCEILTTWKKGQGRKMTTLSKDVFPRLLAQLHNKIEENGKGRQNLISGFAKTGLHPLNPAQAKERLPVSSTTGTDSNILDSSISSSVLDVLKEMRMGSFEQRKAPRRKKLTVKAGNSVSTSDLYPSTSRNVSEISSCESSDDEEDQLQNIDDEDLPCFNLKKPDKEIQPEEHDDENQQEISDDDDHPLINFSNLKVNYWVVVRYTATISSQCYIGQIKSVTLLNGEWVFKTSFLKKSSKTERFLSPPKLDQDEVTTEMIIMILSLRLKVQGPGNFLPFRIIFQN